MQGGADLDTADEESLTPLHMAARLLLSQYSISLPGMVRGRLPLCWSKLVPIFTPPTKKVTSHFDHRQINPKLSTSFIFTNGQSQCKPRRFLNIQYDPLTIAFIIDAHHPPNPQKLLLPPGKTPELLADFVNEQPMKVSLSNLLHKFMNQVPF